MIECRDTVNIERFRKLKKPFKLLSTILKFSVQDNRMDVS